MITKDFYVFELDIASLKGGGSNSSALYLGSRPQPIAEKWPILWSNADFTALREGSLIYNSFTVIDSESEYVLFTTKLNETSKIGVNFDINKNEVFKGYTYDGADDQVMISATEKMFF